MNNRMDIRKMTKLEMVQRDIPSLRVLAEWCGWSTANLSAKLNNHIRVDDLQKVANAMGCELQINFVDKE